MPWGTRSDFNFTADLAARPGYDESRGTERIILVTIFCRYVARSWQVEGVAATPEAPAAATAVAAPMTACGVSLAADEREGFTQVCEGPLPLWLL